MSAYVYNFREFQTALKQVSYAVSTDENRPALQRVHVVGTKHNTKLIAADGFRLAVTKIGPCNGALPFDILMDPAALKAVLTYKVGRKDDPELMFLDDTRVLIGGKPQAGSISPEGREYNYPDVSVVFPRETKTSFTVYPLALLQVLKTARVFSREGSNVVRLHVGESLVVSSLSEGLGESASAVSVYKRNGPELPIAFNVDFLIDCMKQAGAEPVKFELNRKNTPALITYHNGTQVVIMPMNYDNDHFIRAEDMTPAAETTGESYIWESSPRTPDSAEWMNDQLTGKHATPDYSGLPAQPKITDDYFVSTPDIGAVEYDLTGATFDIAVSTPKYGKEIRTPRITLELTNPREIPQPAYPIVVYDPNFTGTPVPVEIPLPAPVEMVRPSRFALMEDE